MGARAPASLEDDGIEVVKDNKNNTSIKNPTTTLIFTYGTLKHGFSNHRLLQDMMSTGEAAYLGLCRTAEKLSLICGPYRVPFLLNFQGLDLGLGHHVWGELYAVSAGALARIDNLKGLTRGHYDRLPINVVFLKKKEDDRGTMLLSSSSVITPADAYYAHRSYAEALWKRNGEMGYLCYSEKEANGYVQHKDKPQHVSFLHQIQFFVFNNHDHNDPLQH